MSISTESPFLLLNAARQISRSRTDPNVPIPSINFEEKRSASTIRRVATSEGLQIQKLLPISELNNDSAVANFNEFDVVNNIKEIQRRALNNEFTSDVAKGWMGLDEYVLVPSPANLVPKQGYWLNQKFAGIDIEDLFQKILPECEGKLQQRPEIHLMVWRGVIQSLRAMHVLGMVHGDAKPDNFCLNITNSWVKSDSNDEDGEFNEVDFSDIKAIDLGLTMLPLQQRVSQKNLSFVLFDQKTKQENPDAKEIMSYGASYDFKYLANHIELYNQHNEEQAKNDAAWPHAFNLQASEALPLSHFDHEQIKKTLLNLPQDLREYADNQGVRHDYLLSVIDKALGIENNSKNNHTKVTFKRITGSSNKKIFAPGRADSVLIPPNPSELILPGSVPVPVPVRTEPVIKPVTKHSLLMPFAMACLLLAGAGAYYYLPRFMDNGKPLASKAVPAKTEPSVTEPTVMMKGLIDKNHPTFLKCTSVLPLVDQVIKGIQPLDDVNRGKLSAARGFCNLLLPREAPEHDELFVTKLSAGYYALLLNDLLDAEATANDIMLTDSKKFRGPLLRAAIRAKKGDDAGFIADLTLSVQNGLPRSELDDESPLYGALAQTDGYQQLRNKAKK